MSNTLPQIGDIYYQVFLPPDDQPWVGRVKIVYISPKGLSIHFETLDTVKKRTLKRTSNTYGPQKTVLEAVRVCQRNLMDSWFSRHSPPEARLAMILSAEKLLPSKTEYNSEEILDRACV